MSELVGQAGDLGWVVVKTVLLFAVALAGFRLGDRRTIAQLSPFDFTVAVALGAIIGRTSTSSSTSFLTGAVALLTLLVVHRIITTLRRHASVSNVVDQPPNVLVLGGELQPAQLARAGLTHGDVSALLREQGVGELNEIDVMLYETRGAVSLNRVGSPRGPLMRDALTDAGYGHDDTR